jgi:hypothetical protein
MFAVIQLLTFLCCAAGFVHAGERKAQLLPAADIENTVLLRLDYGTYRGYYDPVNEVMQTLRFEPLHIDACRSMSLKTSATQLLQLEC